jgi:uncharacterized protein (DUF1697 family)
MSLHAALLRGVNLGGSRRVSMATLREMLEELGLEEGRTLLQSGNLVFRGGRRTPAQLESMLERAIQERFGMQSDVHVRTPGELQAILRGNPMPEEAKRDPSHLLVLFLREAPGKGAETALRKAMTGPETARVKGREAYVYFPEGIARSKLPATLLDRHLGRGTARNWNTVVKLSALLGA